MSTAAVSVSKGLFIFKNGARAATKKSRSKRTTEDISLCDEDSLWYKAYKSSWNSIESKIESLNNEVFSKVLQDLVQYISECYKVPVVDIPGAAILTGINMPDHSAQFQTLSRNIRDHITPHVVTLKSEDCANMKSLVENMIGQLVATEIDSDDEGENKSRACIKKSQCSFSMLQTWYEELYLIDSMRNLKTESPKKRKKMIEDDCLAGKNNCIVVIIPDFEGFATRVLQDFIMIASSYINVLPFVFVFGVATSLGAVHRSLPYHVSSKISLRVFTSPPSTVFLNYVLENVLFSSGDVLFHLGGKVFNLFLDIFLFYDLSVTSFIRNFKYAMLEHFSYGNATVLCHQTAKLSTILADFTHDDFENVRRLMSFRKLVESKPAQDRLKLITDDDYFARALKKHVRRIRLYVRNMHLLIRCLHILVSDLPKTPLGKQVRELYSMVVSGSLVSTPEYKQCFQLLAFQSRDELCSKIHQIVECLVNNCTSATDFSNSANQLRAFHNEIENIANDNEEDCRENNHVEDEDMITGPVDSRRMLKERLLSKMKQSQSKQKLNKYERLRAEVLDYLNFLFETHLVDPTTLYFHEIFFFNDLSIKSHIIGSHRAAIHTALNDPHSYLQCPCCPINDDSVILRTMPDISIAYKLHLECGKMINLYDWLQAFVSIVDPSDDDDNPKIRPQTQARFTQAVAELEYLGFIKSSKRKVDHVARLTWGG